MINIDKLWEWIHDFSIPTWTRHLEFKTADGGPDCLSIKRGRAKSTEYVNLELRDKNKIFDLNKEFVKQHRHVIADPESCYFQSVQTNNATIDFKRFHNSNSILVSVEQKVIRHRYNFDTKETTNRYSIYKASVLIKEDAVWFIKGNGGIRQCNFLQLRDALLTTSGDFDYNQDYEFDIKFSGEYHVEPDDWDKSSYATQKLHAIIYNYELKKPVSPGGIYITQPFSINKHIKLGTVDPKEAVSTIHPFLKTEAGKWFVSKTSAEKVKEAFMCIKTRDLIDFIEGWYELKDILYNKDYHYHTRNKYSYKPVDLYVSVDTFVEELLNVDRLDTKTFRYYYPFMRKSRFKIGADTVVTRQNFRDYGVKRYRIDENEDNPFWP